MDLDVYQEQVMHKACRPKKDYSNPILCGATMTEEDAHKFSRITWFSVDCPKCLKLFTGRRGPK